MDNIATPSYILQDSLQHSLILRNVDRQHPHFWFEDGNLILASAVVDFRVHIEKVVPRSEALTFLFNRLSTNYNVDGIIYLPILGDIDDDWACLLGLIYDEGGNSVVSPTLRELLGVLRVAEKYHFAMIEEWALAHMRADFFPNPTHFQDGDDNPQQAKDMILNSLEVIAVSRYSRIETETLTLAYYALARRNIDVSAGMMRTRSISPLAVSRMIEGREAIRRRFDDIEDKLLKISKVQESTAIAHCSETCGRMLLEWVADARRAGPDVLKASRQMLKHVPPGPVCPSCVMDAHRTLKKEMTSICRGLPNFFGFTARQDLQWELTEDKKWLLSKGFRP